MAEKDCEKTPDPPAPTTDREFYGVPNAREDLDITAPTFDFYEASTSPVETQAPYRDKCIRTPRTDLERPGIVTGVISYINKELRVTARLLKDPNPITDTAESVPRNVKSASHFLPQREYIGLSTVRPKINQVVIVKIPANGSYEIPGRFIRATDEMAGPPIRAPKTKKNKDKGAKAAAKGQPKGGIPKSAIPGDQLGKKAKPENQIPKVTKKPSVVVAAGTTEEVEKLVDERGLNSEGQLVIHDLTNSPGAFPAGPADQHVKDFAAAKAKQEEEKAKREREEATKKAKEDAKKAEDIAKGKKQAPIEEVEEIEAEGDPPPPPEAPVTLTQEERARIKEINIPPHYDEENNRFVAFAKAKGPALTDGTLERSIKRAEYAALDVLEEFLAAAGLRLRPRVLANRRAGRNIGTLDEVTYIPPIPRVNFEKRNTRGDYVKVVVVKVSMSFDDVAKQ